MKQLFTILTLFLISSTLQAQSFNAFQDNASSSIESLDELQDMYLDFFDDRGMAASVDSDGDIKFVVDDYTYYIFSSSQEKDLGYFRIAMPNVWGVEDEYERRAALRAMERVNKELKVVKAHFVDSDVWLGTEIFINDVEDFRDLYDRLMKVISDAHDIIIEEQ